MKRVIQKLDNFLAVLNVMGKLFVKMIHLLNVIFQSYQTIKEISVSIIAQMLKILDKVEASIPDAIKAL